jgi:aminopeptidase N
MAYPTPESEKWSDGRALRLVTTDDFLTIASAEAKQDLKWFFEVYVREAKLPELKSEVTDGVLKLTWIAPKSLPFSMPVDVVVNGKTVRVQMTGGTGTVELGGLEYVIDPNGWVLRQ